MSLTRAIYTASFNGDKLSPKVSTSTNYKHWVSTQDLKRCLECADNHGKIWYISETPSPKPPLHPKCRCIIERMKSIMAGTATINGINGADWILMFRGCLPNYYISRKDVLAKGWKPSKWPSNFVPNKMITGGQYYNDDGHLPDAPGRVWYEADINYKTGRRNNQRILWSNDGLIFVTYDHYKTFYEIV